MTTSRAHCEQTFAKAHMAIESHNISMFQETRDSAPQTATQPSRPYAGKIVEVVYSGKFDPADRARAGQMITKDGNLELPMILEIPKLPGVPNTPNAGPLKYPVPISDKDLKLSISNPEKGTLVFEITSPFTLRPEEKFEPKRGAQMVTRTLVVGENVAPAGVKVVPGKPRPITDDEIRAYKSVQK